METFSYLHSVYVDLNGHDMGFCNGRLMKYSRSPEIRSDLHDTYCIQPPFNRLFH